MIGPKYPLPRSTTLLPAFSTLGGKQSFFKHKAFATFAGNTPCIPRLPRKCKVFNPTSALKASGIAPLNLLLFKYRPVNCVSLDKPRGRLPFNSLASSRSRWSLLSAPVPGGMLPLNWLLYKTRSVKCTNLVMFSGISPVN